MAGEPPSSRTVGGRGVAAPFGDQVARVVASIPAGQVATYGEVAMEAGRPGAARAVGRWLATADPDPAVPWWRVVTATGRLVPGHEREHARRLADEGVVVRDARVVASTGRN